MSENNGKSTKFFTKQWNNSIHFFRINHVLKLSPRFVLHITYVFTIQGVLLSNFDSLSFPPRFCVSSSFHFSLLHEVWKYSKNVTVTLLYLRNKLWLTLLFVDSPQITSWKGTFVCKMCRSVQDFYLIMVHKQHW